MASTEICSIYVNILTTFKKPLITFILLMMLLLYAELNFALQQKEINNAHK